MIFFKKLDFESFIIDEPILSLKVEWKLLITEYKMLQQHDAVAIKLMDL